jgi:hypothetical protein
MSLSIFSHIKSFFMRVFGMGNQPLKDLLERNLILNAKILDHSILSKQVLPSLDHAEYRVFSQWGEDGIISWLLSVTGEIPQTFIEFGVENFDESNTRYLVQSRNWRGLVMDGSEVNINHIRKKGTYWRHDIDARKEFIHRDNINFLISKAGFKGEIGILSIDIDGNDYWIWQAINVISPAIVICEYNAVLGDQVPLTIPYKENFQRSVGHYSHLYFGASIRALLSLGVKKGYTFLGTNSAGCNAFFIRNDLAKIVLSRIDQLLMFPSKIREARDKSGNLSYLSGNKRLHVITDLPFQNVETGAIASLPSVESLYSAQWFANTPSKLRKYLFAAQE